MLKFKLPDYSIRVAQNTITISGDVGLTFAQFWTDDEKTVYCKPFDKKEKGCVKVIEGKNYIVTSIPYNTIGQTGIFRLEPVSLNGLDCFRIGTKLSR